MGKKIIITMIYIFYFCLFVVLAYVIFFDKASASEQEVGYSLLTEHLIGDREPMAKFSHKINNNGLISNPIISLRFTNADEDCYDSFTLFGGQNSVGSSMGGVMGGTGFYLNKNIQTGLVYGGYLQDVTEFNRRGMASSFFDNGRIGFVPVLGGEINFKVKVSDRVFIKQNNTISPFVTNHSISVGVEF